MATVTIRQAGRTVDYTPGSAVDAGDVVVQGDLVGVASHDIAANTLGALMIDGVMDFPKDSGSGTAITAGAICYWDAGNEVATTTAGAHKKIGPAVTAAGTGASTVRCILRVN